MIGLIGINYKTSPLEIREKFSFDECKTLAFYNEIKGNDNITGLVVLSTCNRAEFYFQMEGCCDTAAYSFMLKSLKKFCGIKENVREYFYFKASDSAFQHLFYVVSGFNSMILGEDQIVGQVKSALQVSLDNNISNTEITRLFTKALEVNKKIRTKTKVNKGAFSVSYAGVEKCISVFNDLTSRKILLVGAGEAGTLALKSLMKKGCKNIVITNRTFDKAQRLASKHSLTAMAFDQLEDHLSDSDIVIVSTSSVSPVIDKTMMSNVVQQRTVGKQLFIDLSVPRNVAHEISDFENVLVYDIDGLNEVIETNNERRKDMVNIAEEIVLNEVSEFNDWLSSRNLTDLIASINNNFSSMIQLELESFKQMNKLEEDEMLDNYGNYLTEKYTRQLVKNLKAVTRNGQNQEYIKIINNLFALT